MEMCGWKGGGGDGGDVRVRRHGRPSPSPRVDGRGAVARLERGAGTSFFLPLGIALKKIQLAYFPHPGGLHTLFENSSAGVPRAGRNLPPPAPQKVAVYSRSLHALTLRVTADGSLPPPLSTITHTPSRCVWARQGESGKSQAGRQVHAASPPWSSLAVAIVCRVKWNRRERERTSSHSVWNATKLNFRKL